MRAYTIRRPDGLLAVLLLNVSPAQPYDVALRLAAGGIARAPLGSLAEWQLSSAQYRWKADGPAGHPSLDVPPSYSVLANGTQHVRLPPYSITVLQTR